MGICLFATVVFSIFAVGDGVDTPESRFGDAVSDAFIAYVTAFEGHSSGDEQISEEDVSSALLHFRKVVADNWPYPLPDEEAATDALNGREEVHRTANSEAGMALRAAKAFEKEYLSGRANRDEAVARWLDVVDRFPGTIEHDEALMRAAALYEQKLRGGAQKNEEAAKELYRRLANRPGPPSAYTVQAEQCVAAYHDDTSARAQARTELVADLTKRQDPRWLVEHALIPTPSTTPSEFVDRVVGLVTNLQGAESTTVANLRADEDYLRRRAEHAKKVEQRDKQSARVNSPVPIDRTQLWKRIALVFVNGILLAAAIIWAVVRVRARKS